jgi:hypothetical protein
MIDQPKVIVAESFQAAWLAAARKVQDNGWKYHNLVVQISDPAHFDSPFHDKFCTFAKGIPVLSPKDVAYTIFPHGLYQKRRTRKALYEAYARKGGLYARTLARRPHSWGTYFHRMIAYETPAGPINQLEQIISAVRSDGRVFKGAFSMVIQTPGGETRRRRGGPCLNYIAVQRTEGEDSELGLLCVYRSHDFLERVYGNYWGLCNLLNFMAKESGSKPGALTCISSLAFVPSHKVEFREFLATFP